MAKTGIRGLALVDHFSLVEPLRPAFADAWHFRRWLLRLSRISVPNLPSRISRISHNFCRVHQSLRVTPAMEAGIADHVWSIEELVALLPKPESAMRKVDAAILRKALGETV